MERLGLGRGRGRGQLATEESPAFDIGFGRGRGRGGHVPNPQYPLGQQPGPSNRIIIPSPPFNFMQWMLESPIDDLPESEPLLEAPIQDLDPFFDLGGSDSHYAIGQQNEPSNSTVVSSLSASFLEEEPIQHLLEPRSTLQALMDGFTETNTFLEAPIQEVDPSLNIRPTERVQSQSQGQVQGRGRGRGRGQHETEQRISGVGRGRGSRGRGRGRVGPSSHLTLGEQSGPSNPSRVPSPPSSVLQDDPMRPDSDPPFELRTMERGRGRGRGRGRPRGSGQCATGPATSRVSRGRGHGRGRGRGRGRLGPIAEQSEPSNPFPLVPYSPSNSDTDDSDPNSSISRVGRREESTDSSDSYIVPFSSSDDDSDSDAPIHYGHDSPQVNSPNLPEEQENPPNEIILPPAVRPPLFTKQDNHRSEWVINDENPNALTVRKHNVKKLNYHKYYRKYLIKAGFYGLHRIGYVCSDRSLITALVERWRPETHTFHLPVGEMMVTLQDVAVLLGLPIDGKPVVLDRPKYETYEYDEMIRKYLGHPVDSKTFRSKTGISIRWLKNNFNKLSDKRDQETEEAYEIRVQCHVRALILMMMGSLLFTDLSGDSISVEYLPFLIDLDKVGDYSWGSATLAYLNKELDRACHIGTHQMGGPILLLQIWAWERFLPGRPETRNGVAKPRLGGYRHKPERRSPYGYKWSGLHDWTKNPVRVLKYYRDEFDFLREYQVNWTPYSDSDLKKLPPICTASSHLWTYSGPLINLWIVEPHNPRRVMRQFELYQNSPPTPCALDSFNCSTKKSGRPSSWDIEYRGYLAQWANRANSILEEPRPYDETTYDNYIEWFANNSRLYLQPERAMRLHNGPLRDLLYQVRASITHQTAKKVRELGAVCKNKIREGEEESVKEFALEILRGLKDVLDVIGEFVPGEITFAPLYEENQEQGGRRGGGGGAAGGRKRRRLRGG